MPFLDPVVAELAFALPRHQLKVRGLHEEAAARARRPATLLPPEIAQGRKRGFSIPAAAWLRGPMAPFVRDVLSPETLRRQGFLDAGVVTSLLDAHCRHQEDLSRQLWGLMTLTLWLDQRYANASEPSPTCS